MRSSAAAAVANPARRARTMSDQRMFSELPTGARFRFDHDADSGHVWTKTGRREYSRIETKRIGSTTAPVTPLTPPGDDDGDAVVMLRETVKLLEALHGLERIQRDGNAVIAASDLESLLVRFAIDPSTITVHKPAALGPSTAMQTRRIGAGLDATFDVDSLTITLTSDDGHQIAIEPDALDELGRFARASVYARQSPQSFDAEHDAKREDRR
jgi:hypothetical protein